MLETMRVAPQGYLLAADSAAVWALCEPVTGDAVPADSTVAGELDIALQRRGFDPSRAILRHDTSWHQDGPFMVITHAVIMPTPTVDSFALDLSPDAAPLTAQLLDHFGPMPTHHPAEIPEQIREADVLQHLLRHLKFLLQHDRTAARALGRHWREQLRPLSPALAGLTSLLHAS
jgi:hypothetical protein